MPVLAQDALRRRGLETSDFAHLRFLCLLFCMLGALLAWNLLGNPVSCVAFTLACACMGSLLCCDLRHHVLPTGFVGAMLLLAIVFRLSESGVTACLQCGIFGLCVSGSLMLANAIHLRVYANEIIGTGDVRLIVPLALFSGLRGIGPGLLLSALTMGTISVVLLLSKRKQRDSFVALAPGLAVWLLAGTLIPFA